MTLERTRTVTTTIGDLITAAGSLLDPGDYDSNPEYERALAELITDSAGLSSDCKDEITAAIREACRQAAPGHFRQPEIIGRDDHDRPIYAPAPAAREPRGRATRSVEEIRRDTATGSRIHDHGGGQLCAIDHADTTDVLNRVLAAEAERHTLLAQAAREHTERTESETRRYRDELEHIEAVYRSRTAHLLPASETG